MRPWWRAGVPTPQQSPRLTQAHKGCGPSWRARGLLVPSSPSSASPRPPPQSHDAFRPLHPPVPTWASTSSVFCVQSPEWPTGRPCRGRSPPCWFYSSASAWPSAHWQLVNAPLTADLNKTHVTNTHRPTNSTEGSRGH